MVKWISSLAALGLSAVAAVLTLASFRRGRRTRTDLLSANRMLETALSASRAAGDEWKRQLEHADRLAFLGVATAHVAHEINNPLLFVTINLPHIRKLLPDSGAVLEPHVREELVEALGDAEEGVSRIRTIAADLKAYSRRHEGEPDLVDVREVVRSSIAMVERLFPAQSRIEEHHGGSPVVRASRVRLIQVVVNLLRNALESFPSGRAGNLVTATTGTSPNGSAFVRIEDNGPGMAAELLTRIFEPFFTTKPAQMGTGLGLPICREIVQSLGGGIHVESKSGSGATFEVTLPAATEATTTPLRLVASRDSS